MPDVFDQIHTGAQAGGDVFDQIHYSAGTAAPTQVKNPEGFWEGFVRNVSGLLSAPHNPGEWIQAAGNQIMAMQDQVAKAKEAYSKGRGVEAFGHLMGSAPLIGPPAAHAGEAFGGTEAKYDKFGNVVQPGLEPSLAAGGGETAGLLTPLAVEPALSGTAKAGSAIARTVSKPGTARITGGAAQVAGGAAALAKGHVFVGPDLLIRGWQMLKKGLAERAASVNDDALTGGHDIGLLNDIGHGDFLKMSPSDQAAVKSIADRMKNGLPPAPPPAGPIPGFSQQFMPPGAVPLATSQPAATVPPEAAPQSTVAPGKATAEGFPERARGVRANNAESLAQAFQDAGESPEKLRVWQWPAKAKEFGIDFPVTHEARLKWVQETIRRWQQKQTTKP